jgi:hypothetical protein
MDLLMGALVAAYSTPLQVWGADEYDQAFSVRTDADVMEAVHAAACSKTCVKLTCVACAIDLAEGDAELVAVEADDMTDEETVEAALLDADVVAELETDVLTSRDWVAVALEDCQEVTEGFVRTPSFAPVDKLTPAKPARRTEAGLRPLVHIKARRSWRKHLTSLARSALSAGGSIPALPTGIDADLSRMQHMDTSKDDQIDESRLKLKYCKRVHSYSSFWGEAKVGAVVKATRHSTKQHYLKDHVGLVTQKWGSRIWVWWYHSGEVSMIGTWQKAVVVCHPHELEHLDVQSLGIDSLLLP